MRCTNPTCRAEIPDDSQFCDTCGEPVTRHDQPDKPPADPTAAPGRRVTVEDNSGQTHINSTTTNNVDKSHNPQNSTAALITLGLLAVALLALAGFWLLTWQAQQEQLRQAHATATAIAQQTAVAAAADATQTAQAEATAAALAQSTATAMALAAAQTAQAAATADAHAQATATAQAVEAAYARGVGAMNLGDWPTAYAALRAVFDAEPDYADVQARLAAVILALTPTATPTASSTSTPLPTATATPTDTPAPTATFTPTPLPTDTPAPTATATNTPRPTSTATPTPRPPTNTPAPTATPTPLPTNTLRPTATPRPPTATPTPIPAPAANAAALGEVRIRAEGYGYARETETNAARRERSALLAAEVDAKANLAEWIAGADIEQIAIVTDNVVVTETIRLLVKARLPGTTVVAQSYDAATGEARVTVEMVLRE